ncbi:MAG: hybrid sensor histidine kinase/response regulator [Planctomycetota bacterium]
MSSTSDKTPGLNEVREQLQSGVSMPAELLEIFSEEAGEHLDVIYDGLRRLEADYHDFDALADVRRSSHTLKGAAGAVGLNTASSLAHRMEDLLDQLAENKLGVTDEQLVLLLGTVDQLQMLTSGEFDPEEAAGDIVSIYEMFAEETGVTEKHDENSGTGDVSSEKSVVSPSGPAVAEIRQQLESGCSMPAELLEIFSEEAGEHIDTIYDGLRRLTTEHGDQEALADVRRSAHTLKGAAGAVGLGVASKIAHRMEDLLDHLALTGAGVTEEQLALLLMTVDQLQVLTGSDFDAEEVAEQIVEIYSGYAELTPNSPDQADSEVRPDKLEATEAVSQISPEPVSGNSGASSGNRTGKFLRVPLDRLDDLVSLLGQMMVNRSQFQQRLETFESRIDDMQSALERLRTLAVEAGSHLPDAGGIASRGSEAEDNQTPGPADLRAEFDPLEFERYNESSLLTQKLNEANHDAEMMTGEFQQVRTAFKTLLRRQQQLNRDAQKSLMRIRMVPLSGIVSKLERNVRTVSAKLSKDIDLEITGERIELDKTVLDDITDPLLHLIRNAMDHGIEDSGTRAAAGKSPRAKIRLQAVNQGTQVTLRISDDGGGINTEKVRQKAIAQGLISGQDNPCDEELHSMIFVPGFSTATQLTDVSGRGVGMDVVGETIRRLNGSVRVDSKQGVGTTFTIQLPTSVGLTRAVIVESGGHTFAIPMQSVQQIQQLDRCNIGSDGERNTVQLAEREFDLVNLANHLGLVGRSEKDFSTTSSVLIISDGRREVAVAVDRIAGSRDIVVKSLGSHLFSIRGIDGTTIDGNGVVVPILNTAELTRSENDGVAMPDYTASSFRPVRRNRAMVIDDSISVRRVTGNFLEQHGWEVVTAKDGVDALEKLAGLDLPPDVFLCDMEMPRMDGLELIRQIREQDEFATTPVVMVTSRSSEKHRHKAFDAGATDYVVKPFDGESLLERIDSLVLSARETVTV